MDGMALLSATQGVYTILGEPHMCAAPIDSMVSHGKRRMGLAWGTFFGSPPSPRRFSCSLSWLHARITAFATRRTRTRSRVRDRERAHTA